MSAREHFSEYVLPAEFDRNALARRFDLASDPLVSVRRTYYDTFDGRLHDKGLRLVREDDRLVLRDAADAERASAEAGALRERLFAGDLPPGRLRDELEPLIEMRALLAAATTQSRLRPLRVLDDESKTVVRLVIEEPSLALNGRRPRRLPPRLRLVPVRGYDKPLARVRRELERELELVPAAEPLADEAVRSAGGVVGGTSSKLRVSLAPDQRADAAAVVLLKHLQGTIEQNMPGTLDDVDSEFLHDLRVAVRRSRSAQRQLKRVFPPGPLARFRREFKWLQQATGPSRDLDVYLLEFDDLAARLPDASARADLAPLRAVLEEHQRRERRKLVRALRSQRTARLLREWSELLDGLVTLPDDDRPDAARPAADVGGARIAKVYRRIVKAGAAIDDSSPPEALHELRKTGKELRYLLEFFRDLFPADVVKPMVKSLKALQDTLGHHQDRAVQVTMLRSLRDELVAAPDGAATLRAVGLLIDRLEHEQAQARAEFADSFAAFASRSQRKLVDKTFR